MTWRPPLRLRDKGVIGYSRMVVRGGDVVTPGGVLLGHDVWVEDGRIVAIGSEDRREGSGWAEEVIDASGLKVLPGIIDCHTHLGLQNRTMRALDDYSAGSASAAAGGVTTFCNFAPQERGQSLVAAFQEELARAVNSSHVDFGVHLSLGTPGEGWEEQLAELVRLGVNSLKVYTTYRDTMYYTHDWDWWRLAREAAALGIIVQVHAENDDIVAGATAELVSQGRTSLAFHGASRPEIAEIEAVAKGIAFCRASGAAHYFVHCSSPDAVELIAHARAAEGLAVFAEVCPHHLWFDENRYQSDAARRYVMTPPLRSPEQVARLRGLVASGAVQAVGSDHCGYSLEQRGFSADFREISPGIPGVETLWLVLYTTLVDSGLMPLQEALALVTRGPAEIFGLAPRKGELSVGSDADLVLFDDRWQGVVDETSLHSRAGYSPWHGERLRGRVMRTVLNGKTVFSAQSGVVNEHGGSFVPAHRAQNWQVATSGP